MGQDDDGLAASAAPDPRPGEADLIGRPVAQPLPRAQPPEQIAGRERDGRGDDDTHHPSESSPPHESEQRFKDGWFAGVRDVASCLLRIADTTATTGRRGRAASSAMLLAHLQQPHSPAPAEAPAEDPAPAVELDAKDVLAAAERFPWAVAAPGERHWPDGSNFLDVPLSAMRSEEREGYIERLQAFVEQHRTRLEELLRAYGPDSRPASHDRYALVGQPETLVILEADGGRAVPPARPVGEKAGDRFSGRP
ncbi:hypothetical protein ABZ595_37135 [Streptomyces rubradiris]|uniref:hypothetical protein n=1 Tax=Streptomyces rubradiris TaxID=285531 RepID=UPI003406956F